MSALFANVLTASFHGSIVIAAVLILRLFLKKAPKKYLCYLWLLAGVRLLMPFEIQSDLSLQPQSPPDTVIRWEQPAPIPMTPESSDAFFSQPYHAAEAPAASSGEPSAPAPITVEPSFDVRSLVPFLWIGIASLFLITSAVSYVNLRRKVRDAVKIPGGWESEGIDTAFILGFVKPRIYIPVGMAPAARKHILAHERTHLDKGDHWIKMIGFLALALHWFNPLVWAAYILLCKDIEMACDERVVQFMELKERKEYSTALLNCSTNRIHYAASPVAFGEVSVKSRIQSILNYRKPSFWLGLLSVIAIVFVMVCLVTSPVKSQEEASSAGNTAAAAEFAPAVQPPMGEDSGWGLSLKADVHSPSAATLYYGVGIEGIPWDGTPITMNLNYWLEGWNGETWEALPTLSQNQDGLFHYTTELSKDNLHGFYESHELDWTLTYGKLPEGDYRIGFRPVRNGEAKPHYAWFHIYLNALTGKEAEAVDRCESALDKLLLKDNYACTILDSNEFGNLMPTHVYARSYRTGRIDSYYGDYCFNSYYCDASDNLMTGWASAFYPGKNAHISFPKDESLISEEEVRFLSSWVDMDGMEYHQVSSYHFGADGSLTSIDRLTRSTAEDGALVQSQRSLTVGSAEWGSTLNQTQVPQDSHEAARESPWGLFFRVDDDLLKPTAGDIWLAAGADTVGVSKFTTDSSYWLEKKTGDRWEKLPASGEPSWGSETYRLSSSRTTVVDQVDWTPYYGELEAGLYRMGKRFWNGEDSIIQYAEFQINPKGGFIGQGGEEAIARIDAAIEKIRSGNYCIVQEGTQAYGAAAQINTIYWKYDGTCVTDYYDYWRGDGYSHSAVADPSDDLFYDQWMGYLNWHDPYIQILFPEGTSLISDERISFATSFTNSSSVGYLTHYDIYFDETSAITRIEYQFQDPYMPSRYPTVLTIQEKSDEEIAAWVTKIQEESPR